MTKWTNSDGLVVKFGLDNAVDNLVGKMNDPYSYMYVLLEYQNMVLAGGRVDTANPVVLPAGSHIVDSWTYTIVAPVGAGATLDLGFGIEAGTYTGGDEDGIDVALSIANLGTAGNVIHNDGAMVGAVGAAAATSVDLYPTYDLDTALWTAGKIVVVIKYLSPTFGDIF